ncbi:MAG: hypothetical protein ABR552_01200 [Actinomycetota bacterium]
MRARLLLLVVLSSLMVAGPVARADAPPDWALLTITAGASEAHVCAKWIVTQIPSPDGSAPVFGWGFGHTGFGTEILVRTDGYGPTSISTTKSLGGVSFQVTTEGDPGSHIDQFVLVCGNLAPGERAAGVVFGTGLTIGVAPQPVFEFGDGTFTYDVETGTGSRAVLIAQPDDDGVGASVGSAAFGSSTPRQTADVGIVGAIDTYRTCLGMCRMGWASPDGDMRALSVVSTPAYSSRVDGTFAGPAGEWSWWWTGATPGYDAHGAPVLAAYAPIGDEWTLFRPGA